MLVYLYGMVYRGEVVAWRKQLFMGLIFGIASAVSMNAPITLADGFILDLRNLFIGISAAFFGVIAGLFTLTIAIAMRLSLGGNGVAFALPAMAIVTIVGLAWRKKFWKNESFKPKHLVLLGIMISAHLSVGAFLPPEIRARFWTEVAPIIAIMNLVGAIVLGRLLRRETELLRQEQDLAKAAMTDPLTKLINRRRLEELVAETPISRKGTKGRAILFCDIDNFKEINDTFGHATGDDTLIELTKRLGALLRPSDIFARLAGDEFVIVLPATTLQEAKVVAERCRNAISRQKFFSGKAQFDVSISMGVKWSLAPPAFMDDLAVADTALYQAKSMGRNCVVYDTDAIDGTAASIVKLSATA